MDVQSGESEEEEVMGEGIGELKMEELVGTKIRLTKRWKGADSRDEVKHNERSNQLFS